MFVLNENQKGLASTDKSAVISVLRSTNDAKISSEGHPAQPTQAFVTTLTTQDEKLTTHIIFHLRESQGRIVYSWDGESFAQDQLRSVEEQALDFVENMGFAMDNLKVGALAGTDRNQILDGLPIFTDGMAQEASAEEDLSSPELLLEDVVPLDELEAEFKRPDSQGSRPDISVMDTVDLISSPQPKDSPVPMEGAERVSTVAQVLSPPKAAEAPSMAVKKEVDLTGDPRGTDRMRSLLRFLGSF